MFQTIPKKLVSWCFKPSQPQWIISELRETYIKRYYSWKDQARTAELRPEEQSEKAEKCRVNLWNEIQFEGAIKTEIDTRTEKKEWASSFGLCLWHKPQHANHVRVSSRGPIPKQELLETSQRTYHISISAVHLVTTDQKHLRQVHRIYSRVSAHKKCKVKTIYEITIKVRFTVKCDTQKRTMWGLFVYRELWTRESSSIAFNDERVTQFIPRARTENYKPLLTLVKWWRDGLKGGGEVEPTETVEISSGRISGSRQSMQGCILTSSRPKKREALKAMSSQRRDPLFLSQQFPASGAGTDNRKCVFWCTRGNACKLT